MRQPWLPLHGHDKMRPEDGLKKQLIVVGAGGLGREVFQYALDVLGKDAETEILGFLDDNPAALAGDPLEGKILGNTAEFRVEPQHRFVIGVGDPALRQTLALQIAARGGRFARVIHSLAYVASTARVSDGCVLAPYVFVGAGAQIGSHVVLNARVSIGHDVVLAEHCVLSPHCVVGGGSRLGKGVFMGSSATIVPQRSIGSGSKIAAGSVVLQDVPVGALAVGNPAKARVLFHA
jgi:sugar O-acyltransferase (sialic acid O-acetyltransferase NeuD family)